MDKTAISVVTFEEGDRLDREYWWSRTPQERMQALEIARQIAYGYGPGQPLPRLQRVLEVDELR